LWIFGDGGLQFTEKNPVQWSFTGRGYYNAKLTGLLLQMEVLVSKKFSLAVDLTPNYITYGGHGTNGKTMGGISSGHSDGDYFAKCDAALNALCCSSHQPLSSGHIGSSVRIG